MFMEAIATSALELRSRISSAGRLEVSLVDVPVQTPGPGEVLVRIDAAPLNPSDMGLLFGPANLAEAEYSGTADRPVLRAPVNPATLDRLKLRLDKSLPVGNEGCGSVVRAGAGVEHLLGRTVSVYGGAMYTQYRCLPAVNCLVLPGGVSAEQGASGFVNPLTALGLVETAQQAGHKAIIQTAAGSNVGHMVAKICAADGIPLISIVRRADQIETLRTLGSRYVLDTSSDTFDQELAEAVDDTRATVAFDAVGGPLTGRMLNAMEAGLGRKETAYSRYGVPIVKDVYVYGSLDTRPVEVSLFGVGLYWGVRGWLLFQYLEKIGSETGQRLRERVAREIHTTFATRYKGSVSLSEALSREAVGNYYQRRTGEKYLITPNR
jgi:NADPH2:quinone reductase